MDFILCLLLVTVLCSLGLELVKETETEMKTTSNYTFSSKILKQKAERLNSEQLKIDYILYLKYYQQNFFNSTCCSCSCSHEYFNIPYLFMYKMILSLDQKLGGILYMRITGGEGFLMLG